MAISVESDPTRHAFELLYRQYVADVYRYALALLRDPSEAEDATQATFLNAWRAYRAGQEPHTPQNWLLTIAHNVCRLRFRTRSRRVAEVELDPEQHAQPAPDGPRAADVLEALGELPLNQRAALVMRELEGRSYDEIAEILGVSRAAVETLIFRARRTMRLRHAALRALASIPLPSSLSSFFRDRGIETGASTLLGYGAIGKAAAVVAAGVLVAGAATGPAESKDQQRAQERPHATTRAQVAPDRLAAASAPAAAVRVVERAAPRAAAEPRRTPRLPQRPAAKPAAPAAPAAAPSAARPDPAPAAPPRAAPAAEAAAAEAAAVPAVTAAVRAVTAPVSVPAVAPPVSVPAVAPPALPEPLAVSVPPAPLPEPPAAPTLP
ncbi:MAG TPA: RNA polymerase sigma factor [Gaiellaceae bacterium]|nr:RNA polymerase sigma factor [Gaiellaceae bacterium]